MDKSDSGQTRSLLISNSSENEIALTAAVNVRLEFVPPILQYMFNISAIHLILVITNNCPNKLTRIGMSTVL